MAFQGVPELDSWLPMDRQKIHSRNTLLNATGEGFWGFAMAFHNMNSVIPMFLAQLGASAFIIGMIPGGFILLVALPQILSASLFQGSPHVKGWNVGLHFALGPLALVMGFIFYHFGLTGSAGIQTYLLLWLIWSLGVGFLVPIWADFLAIVTVSGRRGRFLGITFTVNALMGIAGGYVLQEILSKPDIGFPRNFGLAFLIMGAAIFVGNIFFIFMRVIHPPQPRETQRIRWWRRISRIFGENRDFRTYMFTRALGAATMMPMAFYGVDLQARFDLPLSAAGTFTLFLVIGQAIFNIVFGYIGDLFGRKFAISGFFVGHLLAGTMAVIATEPWMAYLTFVFVGMGLGAGQSSFMVFVYEFAGESGDRKMFYAALDTAVAPFIVLYISVAGLIAEKLGMTTLYGISLGLVLTALLIFIFKVHPPKTHDA